MGSPPVFSVQSRLHLCGSRRWWRLPGSLTGLEQGGGRRKDGQKPWQTLGKGKPWNREGGRQEYKGMNPRTERGEPLKMGIIPKKGGYSLVTHG